MKVMKRYIYIIGVALLITSLSMAMLPDDNTTPVTKAAVTSYSDKNVVDEVLWVVGDEPILKSEVEVTRLSMEAEGVTVPEDADCRIPEQLAVQKLFIHQAILDSVEVTESEIAQGIEQRLNYMIQNPMIGSKEKLEEFYRKSMTQIRQDMHDEYKNQLLMQRMQEQLVSDITVSPAEVRAYFRHLPADSVPMVPTTVEVQIITQQPKVRQEEINRIKDELRNFTERVTNGETSFSTLARLYSEDPGSARQGGELGYTGRGMLDPAFAAVAFNLTDAKKISKIVETEFGYHIIQLIDKRGDKINCRHILMKPRVNADEIEQAKYRLDSIAADIRAGKFSFEEATVYLSDDKDTKNSNGLMVNSTESSRTSRFAMKDLPTEVARVVETMQVGEVSPAFQMENNRGKTVCAIVKLKSRTEAHRATITEDFQTMKDVIMEKRRQEVIHDWVVKKIKNTYVRMSPRYDNCDFEYEGWRK
ncbi:MAG: peptidylprolyl isomerase [Prevotella sp.]|nr:peptidylprolyl isomerase [Prevotella sp.]